MSTSHAPTDTLNESARKLQELAFELSDIAHVLDTQSLQLESQSSIWIVLIVIFVLSCFIGYFVVWNVTPALHAPLMSVTNAISSVILVGGILAIAAPLEWAWAGYAAIFVASINITGGFLVSHRMLSMFKTRKKTQT